jgi:MoaA/NifB/PqqE/SkfB family radical SAM enzyme
MAWGWVELALDKLSAPELDWVQVEITTRCNARCCYCPRTALGGRWSSQDMPLALFRSLLRFLGHTRQVHLQGWGEPLLHPQFFEMVRLCKNKGLAVSTTTNGIALDDAIQQRLIDLDVDVLGVSLAGVRPETNDALRAGTSMALLMERMARLAGLKAQQGRERPAVHLAYLNVADSLEDLALLPELACGLGASKIMISEPSPVATPEIPGRTLDPERLNLAEREAAYQRLEEKCLTLGLEVFWASRLREAADRRCTENPVAACVVGVEGQVSPCVFSTAILAGKVDRLSPVSGQPRPRAVAPLVFGDIRRDSLTKIWHSAEYARFRSLFEPETRGARRRWPAQCEACPQRRKGGVGEV